MSKRTTKTFPDDRELIKSALEGDQSAFSKLADKYKDAVSSFIVGIVSQTQDVEDICQDTFNKAFKNLNLYNNQWAFSTWLFTIAQNSALDHYRKLRTKLSPVNNPEIMDANIGAVDLAQSPEERLITHQSFDKLIKAIKSLDVKYRKIAELRFIHEFAYEEIAKELNIPINTVKTRINRAKKLLTDIWKS